MHKSFKFIKWPLSFAGFNIYNESPTILHTFRRVIFYLSTLAVLYCIYYTVLVNEETNTSDSIFLNITALAFISGILQGILFWKNRDKIVKVTKYLEVLYKEREESWLEPLVRPLFDECARKVFKMTKYRRFYFKTQINFLIYH